MSNDPPPPYPGDPSAPLLEEKTGGPPGTGRASPAMVQPPGIPLPPPDIGPPPYEPPLHPQPNFVPPHLNADGTYMPPGFYPPPGPHPPMGYYPTGPYPGPGGHTATVLVPSGAATTVTVLQGEIFEGAPVQTVCPHCQQSITTKISYEIGLMNFVLGFFCCFMGYVEKPSLGKKRILPIQGLISFIGIGLHGCPTLYLSDDPHRLLILWDGSPIYSSSPSSTPVPAHSFFVLMIPFPCLSTSGVTWAAA
uniref:Cell death-inducing p53-target protein 1 n=1 Tax=Monodelphis domestica TaxID=13616 RepID=A0A5F8GXQ1_MONDO